MATTTIRCDKASKEALAEVDEYSDLDLSSVTHAFWKQIGRTHKIPLDLGNEMPNDESLRSILEADEILANGGTGQSYDSGRDLLAATRA